MSKLKKDDTVMISERFNIDISWTSLSDAIETLINKREELSKLGLSDLMMNVQKQESAYEGDVVAMYITGKRPENAAETRARLEAEEERKRSRRWHYEQLKKEFEGK